MRFEDALAAVPIFSGLSAEQRAAIAVQGCRYFAIQTSEMYLCGGTHCRRQGHWGGAKYLVCSAEKASFIFQDCLEPETFAEGDYVLREGEPLGADAKFYLIESGTVTCFRSNQVQYIHWICAHRPSLTEILQSIPNATVPQLVMS